jgi:hypothetical protein
MLHTVHSMKLYPLAVILVLFGSVAWSEPYESKVKKIDQMTMALDNDMQNLKLRDNEDCQSGICVKTLSYRNAQGRIVKTIEEVRSQAEPGSITSRYYEDCKMILSRVAPLDPAAAKDPKNISKYYFDDGKLLRITFGGEIRTFGEEQTEFYARTHDRSALHCEAEPQ